MYYRRPGLPRLVANLPLAVLPASISMLSAISVPFGGWWFFVGLLGFTVCGLLANVFVWRAPSIAKPRWLRDAEAVGEYPIPPMQFIDYLVLGFLSFCCVALLAVVVGIALYTTVT